MPPCSVYTSARDRTQSLVYGRQAPYQLSHTPGQVCLFPFFFFYVYNYVCGGGSESFFP